MALRFSIDHGGAAARTIFLVARGFQRDHALHTLGRFGHQRRDQARFRQILPIAHRHLFFHRGFLDAGRVEDAAVVGEPERFVGIGGGCIGGVCAGAQVQLAAMPFDRHARRQDGPVDLREAAREEWRNGFEHVVVRLEPGNVAYGGFMRGAIGFGRAGQHCCRRRLRHHFAKTHERVHLVHFATHGVAERFELDPVGVERVLRQLAVCMQAPHQAVQQIEACAVCVQQRRSGAIDERSGQLQRRRNGQRSGIDHRAVIEQVGPAGRVAIGPAHIGRRGTFIDQCPRRMHEAGPVDRASERDGACGHHSHPRPAQTNSSCCAGLACCRCARPSASCSASRSRGR